MRLLPIKDHKDMNLFISQALEVAKKATCTRKKGGSVIVYNGEIIGEGFNSPPGHLDSQIRCTYKKSNYHKKVTDKTCCMHAEQRAILDALKKNPTKLKGSTLYYVMTDKHGNVLDASDPYCTICSKMALDEEIEDFVLVRGGNFCVYNTEEYNDISFAFKG